MEPGASIEPGALALLEAWRWPGNIRELRSVLTRLIVDRPGQSIGREAVAAALYQVMPRVEGEDCAGSLRDSVRGRILAAHRDAGGNLSETARRLGVSRNTVYRAIAPR